MKVKDLLEVLSSMVAEGRGDADVLFDTDAACFNVHLVDVDKAFPGEKDEIALLGHDHVTLSMSTYHGSCACKREVLTIKS